MGIENANSGSRASKGKYAEGGLVRVGKELNMPKSSGRSSEGIAKLSKKNLVTAEGSRFNVLSDSSVEQNCDMGIPEKTVLAEITNTGGRNNETGSRMSDGKKVGRTGEGNSSSKFGGDFRNRGSNKKEGKPKIPLSKALIVGYRCTGEMFGSKHTQKTDSMVCEDADDVLEDSGVLQLLYREIQDSDMQGFKNLTSLTELDLSDDSISTLPPQLGLLEPSLQAPRLDGNPLRSIRRTILDRGTKGVLKYLKDKLPEN
ncbi:hypothetical protein ACOSQ4_031121 [Xanthoceras sorbifolium]